MKKILLKLLTLIIFLNQFALLSQIAECPAGKVVDPRYPDDSSKCDTLENLKTQLCLNLPAGEKRDEWLRVRYEELNDAFTAYFVPPIKGTDSVDVKIQKKLDAFKKQDAPKDYAINLISRRFEKINPRENPENYKQLKEYFASSGLFSDNKINCLRLRFVIDAMPDDIISNKDEMYQILFQESCRDDAIVLKEIYNEQASKLQENLINKVAEKLPQMFESPIIQNKGIYNILLVDEQGSPVLNNNGDLQYALPKDVIKEPIRPKLSFIEFGPPDKIIKWEIVDNFDIINSGQLFKYLKYVNDVIKYCLPESEREKIPWWKEYETWLIFGIPTILGGIGGTYSFIKWATKKLSRDVPRAKAYQSLAKESAGLKDISFGTINAAFEKFKGISASDLTALNGVTNLDELIKASKGAEIFEISKNKELFNELTDLAKGITKEGSTEAKILEEMSSRIKASGKSGQEAADIAKDLLRVVKK